MGFLLKMIILGFWGYHYFRKRPIWGNRVVFFSKHSTSNSKIHNSLTHPRWNRWISEPWTVYPWWKLGLPPTRKYYMFRTLERNYFKKGSIHLPTFDCEGGNLRVYKVYHIVDGRNPAPPGMYKTCQNGRNYLSTGAGFCPSTVLVIYSIHYYDFAMPLVFFPENFHLESKGVGGFAELLSHTCECGTRHSQIFWSLGVVWMLNLSPFGF